jgi:predicted phage terminase large subunit-like protein
MMNIRNELENNELLKKDLGPFQEEGDEWGSHSLVFREHGARITVASIEQSIRGLRHNQYRPDLFICDDVEDFLSTRTQESRDKIYRWLRGEVIPAGDKNTRLIIVGNLLHEDSLLMRIKEEINQARTKGIFKEYPLLDRDESYESCLWPGKFKSIQDIEELKAAVVNEASWQREYLLRIIPSDDQVIYPEWIHYYDQLPGTGHKAYRGTYAGVDIAISLEDRADFTSIVLADIYGRKDRLRIYIRPNPINQKLDFPTQLELLKNIRNTQMTRSEDEIFIESNGLQKALQQMLDVQGIEAKAIRSDDNKRIRLSLTSSAIKSGIVKFPKQGCEKLIKQLVGFGSEKHDDMADAFSILVNATLNKHINEPKRLISLLGGDDNGYLSDYIDVG